MKQDVLNSAVQFYISATLNEALTLTKQNGDDLPHSAICFVNDGSDNYIVLDGEIYGGVTSLELNKIPVTRVNGVVTSTLADYFDSNGVLLSRNIKIVKDSLDGNDEPYLEAVITLNQNGIFIGDATNNNKKVLTKEEIETLISTATTSINDSVDSKLDALEGRINQKIGGVYNVKGSLNNYSDLLTLPNETTVKVGDVYNIKNETRLKPILDAGNNIIGYEEVYPPGTNFVCNQIIEEQGVKTYSWDSLGGTVDFDNYYNKSQVDDKDTAKLNAAKAYTDQKIQELTSGAGDLGQLATQVGTNTTNISILNARLTWQ